MAELEDKDPVKQPTSETPGSGEPTSEPLMKTPDVMNYLKVSRTKLWQLVKEGGLPAYRIGGDFRYRQSEIDAWLEARRHGPARNHSKEAK